MCDSGQDHSQTFLIFNFLLYTQRALWVRGWFLVGQGPTFDLRADDWEGVCPSLISREWLDLSRQPRGGNSQLAGGRLLSEHYKHKLRTEFQLHHKELLDL